MKISQVCSLILCLVLISSCALKIPEPRNPANGIVAIPVQASNSTDLRFTRYYKLSSSVDPDIVITVYPHVGQRFVFSEELAPGNYYFDRLSTILNGQVAQSTINKSTSSIDSLIVAVQPGSVSVANQELVIKQIKAGPYAIRSRWNFKRITDAEMQSHIKELQNLENGNKWRIAGSD